MYTTAFDLTQHLEANDTHQLCNKGGRLEIFKGQQVTNVLNLTGMNFCRQWGILKLCPILFD